MSRSFIIIGCLLLGAARGIAAVAAESVEFDRYRVILDRKPFGEITPAETSSTSAPTETLTKDLEMRAIIDEAGGMRVGFLDKKSNKTFYLGVGETNETYELVSVNYDEEEAILRKGTETTLFTLKPNKTPSGPGQAATPGLTAAPKAGAPSPGLLPFGATGKTPSQGFTPVPLSGSQKPFFSDLKKKKFSPFKPLGTNAPTPFQTQSLEGFMKANSNAAQGFPAPVRPFQPVAPTESKGDTIDGFLRANPDAARQFSPLKPAAPNVQTDGRGATIDNLLMQNQGQTEQPQDPAAEESEEAPEE